MTDSTIFPFVVVYENGVIAGKTHQEISRMYDLSDCIDPSETGVVGVYAADENNQLVKVIIGNLIRETDADERSIIYAHSEILAGKRRAGTIHWSDH